MMAAYHPPGQAVVAFDAAAMVANIGLSRHLLRFWAVYMDYS